MRCWRLRVNRSSLGSMVVLDRRGYVVASRYVSKPTADRSVALWCERKVRKRSETVAAVSIDAPLSSCNVMNPASRAVWCPYEVYTSLRNATRAVSAAQRSIPGYVPYADASEASSCVLWFPVNSNTS